VTSAITPATPAVAAAPALAKAMRIRSDSPDRTSLFVELAVRAACELIGFPSVSVTGSIPAPDDIRVKRR
jgi:hypothetical protein